MESHIDVILCRFWLSKTIPRPPQRFLLVKQVLEFVWNASVLELWQRSPLTPFTTMPFCTSCTCATTPCALSSNRCALYYCTALIFRGSKFSRFLQIWLCSQNTSHLASCLLLQRIHEIFKWNCQKEQFSKNLDPRNISAIQYNNTGAACI